MRRLGLVIDLRADTDRLARATFLTGRITVPVDTEAGRTTRMRVEQTADKALVTFSEESDWQQGALTLGDEKRFTVLDIDADGSAIKTERFLWTIPQAGQDPGQRGPGRRRDPGAAVGRPHRRAHRPGTRHQAPHRPAGRAAGRGRHRRRERPDHRGRHPRHARRGVGRHRRTVALAAHPSYRRGGDRGDAVVDDLLEEGLIQGTAAHETPGEAASAVHVHEAMFGWEGWSLSAPRPGQADPLGQAGGDAARGERPHRRGGRGLQAAPCPARSRRTRSRSPTGSSRERCPA